MQPTEQQGRFASLGVPAAGLAALPACPACYPLYAVVLSSLGLPALLRPGVQILLTLFLLAISLAVLAFHARTRRGYAPFALGLAASSVVLLGKFGLGWQALAYAGAASPLAANLWNAWPQRRDFPECPSCAPGASTKSLGAPSGTG